MATTRAADLQLAQAELVRTTTAMPPPSSALAPAPRLAPLTQSQPPAPAPPANAGADSISLVQLKQITAALPKPKQSVFTFPAPPPDSDTLLCEIQEFYSYVEVPQVLEHKNSFNESWPHPTEFADTPKHIQLAHITSLLDNLNSTDPDQRFTAARNVLYIAQGTFAASNSAEQHLSLILQNVALLREAGALQRVWEAVKGTGLRWEGVSGLPDPDAPPSPHFSAQDRQDYLEEINGELAIHLAVLYFMVEVFRGDDEWGAEVMALEPPMPIYLFNLVAGLREKNAKGYPVKKLLLLLWKSILATLGGQKDVARVKVLVRDVEGLPADMGPKNGSSRKPSTKASPTDLQTFQAEISSKYPSYNPPPLQPLPLTGLPFSLDRLAAAAAPTPIRSTFSYHVNASSSTTEPQGPIGGQPPVQGGTPAPTPPASPAPKLKKQQFQTDQTRPFLLPFSPANALPLPRDSAAGASTSTAFVSVRKVRSVPKSIDEAGELYERNLRISTELWQTWKVREECQFDEMGVSLAESLPPPAPSSPPVERMSALSMQDEEEEMDPLSMLRKLASGMQEEEDVEQDDRVRDRIKSQRGDVLRLERVEVLYRAILPQMQSAVIVLLKLLLATVTANNNIPANGQGVDSGTDDTPALGLEDTDIMRHREITSKAVSAILILTLKWFKTSHVMKFHYLSQLLVDSNCLLLILKMFGLQEVSTSVRTKNEVEDYNFFRYCALYGSNSPAAPRPEDAMLSAPPLGISPSHSSPAPTGSLIISSTPLIPSPAEDEIELISDYSWRNFFSVINFVHILQKLTKRKTHRVLLLVQYKSSAILKRILKVSHPTLQLYVLKVIKSQVPYCGRKWRQSNMKVITAIYLHCRPDLRDEWLTGIDVDADVEDSLPHEQALRSLVRFFNTKHYGAFAPLLHRRSSIQAGAANGSTPSSPSGGPAQGDELFPPARSVSSFDDSSDSPFRSSTAYETDDLLDSNSIFDAAETDDLLYPRYQLSMHGELETDPASSRAAWDRLGDILGHYDDVSDSESVGSLGFMRFGSRGDEVDSGDDSDAVSELDIEDVVDERVARRDWEAIAPETIASLESSRNLPPNSPRPRRRSSTGPISPALRPVLIDRDEDAIVLEEMEGPAPIELHEGPAVDEVELIFGK